MLAGRFANQLIDLMGTRVLRTRIVLVAASLLVAILLNFAWIGPAHSQGVGTSQYNFAKLDSPAERFQPFFGADIGFLGLKRSAPPTAPFVFTDTAQLIATTDVLEPEMEAGVRASISAYNLSKRLPGLDMDFVFMGVDQTIANPTVNTSGFSTTNVNPAFYGGFPIAPVPSYTPVWTSDLKSYEWSLGYRPIARLRVTAGVRYLGLEEKFDVLETGTRSGFFSHAKNRAVGPQVGGEATIWTNGRVRIYGKGKYAHLENGVRGSAQAANASLAYSGEEDTSLVDLQLGITAWVSHWASLQLSYQGLFLEDGVGAVEQSSAQSFFFPATQHPAFHEIDWQGLHFGLNMVW